MNVRRPIRATLNRAQTMELVCKARLAENAVRSRWQKILDHAKVYSTYGEDVSLEKVQLYSAKC